MQKETKRTRNTVALLHGLQVLHGLRILLSLLESNIPLLLGLNNLGTERFFLLLMRLTLSLHLSPKEVKISFQGAHFGRQLFLVFRREKEAGMIMRKGLIKKRQRKTRNEDRRKANIQRRNDEKTYLEFFSKRSRKG